MREEYQYEFILEYLRWVHGRNFGASKLYERMQVTKSMATYFTFVPNSGYHIIVKIRR